MMDIMMMSLMNGKERELISGSLVRAGCRDSSGAEEANLMAVGVWIYMVMIGSL